MRGSENRPKRGQKAIRSDSPRATSALQENSSDGLPFYVALALLLIDASPTQRRQFAKSTFNRTYKDVADIKKHAEALQEAQDHRLLSEHASVDQARLCATLGCGSIPPNLRGIRLLRVAAAAELAGVPIDHPSAGKLADYGYAVLAFAPYILDAGRWPDGLRPKKQEMIFLAQRSALNQWAADRDSRYISHAPTPVPLKDPFVVAALDCALEGQTISDALDARFAEKVRKNSLIPLSPDRWNRIIQWQALRGQNSVQLKIAKKAVPALWETLETTLLSKSARTATGWMPIAKAHQLYVLDHGAYPLISFKNQILELSSLGLVDLAPVSVGSVLADDLVDKSEVESGGLAYHLLRLRRTQLV